MMFEIYKAVLMDRNDEKYETVKSFRVKIKSIMWYHGIRVCCVKNYFPCIISLLKPRSGVIYPRMMSLFTTYKRVIQRNERIPLLTLVQVLCITTRSLTIFSVNQMKNQNEGLRNTNRITLKYQKTIKWK